MGTDKEGGDRQELGHVPVQQFTTSNLPPEDRYLAWRDRDWPRSDRIYRTEPYAPFDTFCEAVALGDVTFVYTEISGMRWERTWDSVRTSSFDPIIVNMMIEGFAEGDLGGRSFREPKGSILFHDLGKPSVHVSTASRTYALVVPRQIAKQWLGPLDDLHGLVISPPAADIVLSHAREVHRMLRRLSHDTAKRLGRVFHELIAAIVADDRPRVALPTKLSLLRTRAEAEVERRLGEESITSEGLCHRLGISRAALYEVFQGEGGLQKYALATRLERARAALADLHRVEAIGDIAHRLGFSDASHLSRTFRGRFGMTPRGYRRLAYQSGSVADPG